MNDHDEPQDDEELIETLDALLRKTDEMEAKLARLLRKLKAAKVSRKQ